MCRVNPLRIWVRNCALTASDLGSLGSRAGPKWNWSVNRMLDKQQSWESWDSHVINDATQLQIISSYKTCAWRPGFHGPEISSREASLLYMCHAIWSPNVNEGVSLSQSPISLWLATSNWSWRGKYFSVQRCMLWGWGHALEHHSKLKIYTLGMWSHCPIRQVPKLIGAVQKCQLARPIGLQVDAGWTPNSNNARPPRSCLLHFNLFYLSNLDEPRVSISFFFFSLFVTRRIQAIWNKRKGSWVLMISNFSINGEHNSGATFASNGNPHEQWKKFTQRAMFGVDTFAQFPLPNKAVPPINVCAFKL